MERMTPLGTPHIPGARFIGFPTGGHLWIGHQEEVMSAIADFLK
jgi:2-hydroxy-6-oxonona-2,4-dienedioate hydrolase